MQMQQASQATYPEQAHLPIPESAAMAAVDWFVELQSAHVSAVTRSQWLAWRNAHPDHERAWQRIESVRGTLGSAGSPVKSTIAHAALTARGSSRRKQAIKVLSVLLFTGSIGWLAERQTPWQKWRADLQTAVGEQKTLYLDDGTQLVLNTDTAINLHFNDDERRIALMTGEVLITTGKDKRDRPFLVDAPQGRMRALGTVFSVREEDGITSLAVFDGAVEVWPSRLAGQSLVVHAGQQVSFTDKALMPLAAANADSLAWKDNMLVVKGMRLDDFLHELQRYSNATLSCETAIASRSVSGSYPLENIDTIVETLSAMLGLHVEKIQRLWGRATIRFGTPDKHASRDYRQSKG